MQIGLEGIVIEAVEGVGIIESLIHRIGLAVMLMQDVEVEGIGPPDLMLLAGRGIGTVGKGALTGPASVFVHLQILIVVIMTAKPFASQLRLAYPPPPT